MIVLWFLGCPAKTVEGPPEREPPAVYRWRAVDSTVSPELLRSLMDDFYDLELLLAVSQRGDRATVVVASAQGETQDSCAVTSTLSEVAVGADGAFTITGQPITFAAASLQASLYEGQIQGRIAPDGLTLTEVKGLVDTREFLPLLGSGPDSALCDMMPAMGACVPCPDGQPLCWSASFGNGAASPAPAAVRERTRETVCADPACSSRCPETNAEAAPAPAPAP